MAISFAQQLQRQLRYIDTSAREYDSGNREEAIRIATSLRVMFYNTRSSTSVLKHLDAQEIELCSTSAGVDPADGIGLNVANNLITNVFTGEVRAAPWLDKAPKKAAVLFSLWWEGEVVLFNSGIHVTRKDLVLWAANKDGGAHVDSAQDANYEKVVQGLDFKLIITRHDDGNQLHCQAEEIHLAALRQFAYEVLVSPDLLKLAWPLPTV